MPAIPTPPLPGVVIVTGASSGIGRATADTLHAGGWTVIGASRRGGDGALWRHDRVDVTDLTGVDDFIQDVANRHGRIDAVVCCAGVGVAGPIETSSIDDARQQFDTNYWGSVYTVRAALSHLRAARGRVVVVSSVAGAMGIPFQGAYAASKFALEGWAESLYWEVAPFGVSVTLVQPGNFRTGFTAARCTTDEAGPYAEASNRAISKMEHDELHGGDPQRVATTIAALLSRRRPPLRVSVGSVAERTGLWLRRLLPFRVFVSLARRSLTGG